MCIIVAKPTDVAFPADSTFSTCFRANKDGAGFAYMRKGESVWHVRKGLMTIDAFLKSYHDCEISQEDFFAAHFRIGTSGPKDGRGTHPFPLTNDYDLLTSFSFNSESILFHNGVFGAGTDACSDTMLYVKNILSDNFVVDNIDNDVVRSLITESIAASRLLICARDKAILFGSGWLKDNGVYYSNSSYGQGRSVVSNIVCDKCGRIKAFCTCDDDKDGNVVAVVESTHKNSDTEKIKYSTYASVYMCKASKMVTIREVTEKNNSTWYKYYYYCASCGNFHSEVGKLAN
jgi:hypothetical protein